MGRAQAVRNTAAVFDQTLSAYLNGGYAPLTLDPNAAERQLVKEFTDAEQLQQLKLIAGIWSGFSSAIDTVLAGESEAEVDAALAFIFANNVPLLKESNKAVLMFQREASEKAEFTQLELIIVTVLTACLLLWLLLTMMRALSVVGKLSDSLGVSSKRLDQSSGELSQSSQAVADSASDQANSLKEISAAL